MDGPHSAAYGTGNRRYVGSLIAEATHFTRSSVDCVTAVNVSVKDQLTLSSAVAIGSTIVSGRSFALWTHSCTLIALV